MKRIAKFMGLALLAATMLALLGAGSALAQRPNPRGSGPCQESSLLNIDPAQMHAAIAEALGMSASEFEAARAEGLTLLQIAREQGVALEEVREAMGAVREAAIEEALAAGDISAEQAEALRSHPGGYGYGYGYGARSGPRNGQGYGAKGQHRGQGLGMGNGGWGR